MKLENLDFNTHYLEIEIMGDENDGDYVYTKETVKNERHLEIYEDFIKMAKLLKLYIEKQDGRKSKTYKTDWDSEKYESFVVFDLEEELVKEYMAAYSVNMEDAKEFVHGSYTDVMPYGQNGIVHTVNRVSFRIILKRELDLSNI